MDLDGNQLALDPATEPAASSAQAPDDVRLIRELAAAIAQSATVADAAELTLREICAHTGWAMGQAWTRNGAPYLECSPCWCATSEDFRSLRTRSESLTFRLGEGLPGSAWSTKRPVWVRDVGSRPDLPRGPFAREVGLSAGVAVPVLGDGEVMAVLEFFMAEATKRDEAMTGLVSAAAAQLGSLMLRRRAEDAVQATEESFRRLVESVEDCAIFKIDTNGQVASWNSGAQRICGYRADEIIGYHVSRFYPPEAVLEARPELHLEQARANGRFEEMDWRVREDGLRFWASVVITALHDSGGQLRGFSHVIRDATPMRQMEDELQWLRAVVECSGEAIIGLAPENGIITTWNASAQRLFGFSAREVTGRSVSLLMAPENLRAATDALAQVVSSSRVARFEVQARRKNGGLVDVTFTASPVLDTHGKVIGISAIAEDVTDHKCARRYMERTLGAYMDPGVAGRILNDGAVPRAVETEVTIMFVDIRDFTALADGVEPQEVVDKLNRFFELAVPVITTHGGQVDKFVGDGLLAVFGTAPERENHADDAMCAALEIECGTEREFEGGLGIGIGIHTGRVVLGSVGGGGRLDFTVIGDSVNTAARIEGATRRTGDRILFSKQTRDRLRNVEVASIERPAVRVKGKREPLPLYAPLTFSESSEHALYRLDSTG